MNQEIERKRRTPRGDKEKAEATTATDGVSTADTDKKSDSGTSKSDEESHETLPIVFPALVSARPLASSYMSVQGTEPAFTNYTLGFVGTLDYVWFDPTCGSALGVLALPAESEITNHTKALPSQRFPSDHLPLMAALSLRHPLNR